MGFPRCCCCILCLTLKFSKYFLSFFCHLQKSKDSVGVGAAWRAVDPAVAGGWFRRRRRRASWTSTTRRTPPTGRGRGAAARGARGRADGGNTARGTRSWTATFPSSPGRAFGRARRPWDFLLRSLWLVRLCCGGGGCCVVEECGGVGWGGGGERGRIYIYKQRKQYNNNMCLFIISGAVLAAV